MNLRLRYSDRCKYNENLEVFCGFCRISAAESDEQYTARDPAVTLQQLPQLPAEACSVVRGFGRFPVPGVISVAFLFWKWQ